MKTTVMAKSETVDRKWYVVDATNIPVGRVASQVAAVLRGKNKPIYTPHVDTGDYVIVINTDKMVLTGNKLAQKKYFHHTGYPGGIKEVGYTLRLTNGPDVLARVGINGASVNSIFNGLSVVVYDKYTKEIIDKKGFF